MNYYVFLTFHLPLISIIAIRLYNLFKVPKEELKQLQKPYSYIFKNMLVLTLLYSGHYLLISSSFSNINISILSYLILMSFCSVYMFKVHLRFKGIISDSKFITLDLIKNIIGIFLIGHIFFLITFTS